MRGSWWYLRVCVCVAALNAIQMLCVADASRSALLQNEVCRYHCWGIRYYRSLDKHRSIDRDNSTGRAFEPERSID